MEHIKKFYSQKYLDRQRAVLARREEPQWVAHFLVGEDELAKRFQEQFDQYLELAFRHNLLSKDLKERLHSTEGDRFYQACQELMSAHFVEKILGYKISFHPKGSGSSIGDFLIEHSKDINIFVEVKAPIRELATSLCMGTDSKVIKDNVKAARKQMPASGPNLMIVAGSLRLPMSSESSGILEALYGEPFVIIPNYPYGRAGEESIAFDPSGMFQPTANTRISAVATLEDPLSSFKYIFKVYHNPYAQSPISREVFKDWPQLLPNMTENKIKMEWINGPDSWY